MKKKRLFLIDAYALIFRAYHAMNRMPRRDSAGNDTTAIFGFALLLEDIISKERPEYIAVVFDPPGGSFRREIYPEYKAHRDATPEVITWSVPYIKELISAYSIPLIEVAGYEADDVIGTLSQRASREGFEVYMVTPDKDFGQLVTKEIQMYKPRHKGGGYDIWGPREVAERFGLNEPQQVRDYLGLVGDSSDNIPGGKGIGEKTASSLLKSYGTIEEIYQHLDELKPRMKKLLEEGRAEILLSQQLATIVTDAPVEVSLESLKARAEDLPVLEAFFSRFDIVTLASKVKADRIAYRKLNAPEEWQGSLFESAEFPSEGTLEEKNEILSEVKQPSMEVQSIENEGDIDDFLLRLDKAEKIAIATLSATPSLFQPELLALAVALDEECYYIGLPAEDTEVKALLAKLSPLFRAKQLKVVYGAKRMMHQLSHYGIQFEGALWDVLLGHYLYNPELPHGLEQMAQALLGASSKSFDSLVVGQRASDYDLRFVAAAEIREYLVGALQSLLPLYEKLHTSLEEMGMTSLMEEVELPLMKVLFKMEETGVPLDVLVLREQMALLEGTLQAKEQQIYQLAGESFNINSPKRVGEILFDKLKITDKATKTKSGSYKTAESELEKVAHLHPIVSEILAYRGLKKLLTTYLSPLPSLLHSDGRLHSTFRQAVTATGRLSSTDPNIQNIPIRTEEGRQIRAAFTGGKGNLFLSADYSQIELRLMAHYAEDPFLIEAFQRGEDIHQATAARVFHVELDAVTPEMRRLAKTANFGIIYGISDFGLSERLQISRKESKALIEGYFESYPAVKLFIERQHALAKEQGYVYTLFGRRRYLPDIYSRNAAVRKYAERNAVNAPLQGSAADIIKLAMVRIDAELQCRGLSTKLFLQVHDELNFDLVPEEETEVRALVREAMEGVCPELRVPLVVEIGVGENWLEAH